MPEVFARVRECLQQCGPDAKSAFRESAEYRAVAEYSEPTALSLLGQFTVVLSVALS